eukprot:gb/GEZN01001078.1/.p1 GENE.gb/GEZN01001078.1/~~gb/GEZN01001078.1/.p1  ORF type:complete len:1026 (-),score=226.37 gb/GEZN01001078.1/:180-3257(-)
MPGKNIERKKATIEVPAEDPEKPEETLDAKRQREAEEASEKHKKQPDDKPKDTTDEELSEEDEKLKSTLDLLVVRITEVKDSTKKDDLQIQHNALEALRTEIRSSTSSMTSIPKPLKFLKPHWGALKEYHATGMPDGANKKFLSDILSVLAMTLNLESERASLKYKLQGSEEEVGQWGHEYCRHLAGEIGAEYKENMLADRAQSDQVMELVKQVVTHCITHNAIYEAVDLLLEVEKLDWLKPHVTKDNFARICEYLLACADYLGDLEEQEKIRRMALSVLRTHEALVDAVRVALKLQDKKEVLICFKRAGSKSRLKKQMGYLVAQSRMVMTEEDLENLQDMEDTQAESEKVSAMDTSADGEQEEEEEEDEKEKEEDEAFDVEALLEIVGNTKMHAHYIQLATELDVMKPKVPDDIYKQHLVENRRTTRPTGPQAVDSAKQNLASTFVNAFVNCGFCKDTLMTPEKSEWLFKNKGHGLLSAAASLGMILLWDVETGLSAVDKYSFSTQTPIKAGALLAAGILSCGVTSEMDAALALLSEHVTSDNKEMRTAAVFGLGLAYAGSAREDVLEILVPLIVDDSQSMEIVSLTCLSLGLVFVGSANEDITGSIVEAFLDRSDTDLRDSSARLMCLGLALLFLGVGDKKDGVILAIEAIQHPIKKYLAVTIDTCAYAGTGNVLAMQRALQQLTEHITQGKKTETKEGEAGAAAAMAADAAPAPGAAAAAAVAAGEEGEAKEDEEKKEDNLKGMHQQAACLGIALVAMGDEINVKMALRALDHVLQYAELNVRRVMPLALSLLSVSKPRILVIDTLSKLSHDSDQQVSQNALLALGILGAGTNNSRIAGLLRQLAGFYAKEPNHLFLVRIAQGLLHMGKGLLSLAPFHSAGFLLSKVAVAGLLTLLHSAMDAQNSILSHRHYLLYSIVCAVKPRCLVTLDSEGKFLPVSVRVGTAVDTVGQTGRPKGLTGFQTHKSPVLLSQGERAELASDEYLTDASVLEGFVVVRKNPDAEAVTDADKVEEASNYTTIVE